MKNIYWVSITKGSNTVCVLFRAVSSDAARVALELQGYAVNFVHIN